MSGKRLHTILITASPAEARAAQAAGVDLLFVDLETLGKADRQGHLDTWKSPHQPEDIGILRAAVPEARILVRLNPLYAGSPGEVDDALARGADALMLPMFRDADTVARYLDIVAGRAPLVPLVETAGALAAVPEIAARCHPDQLHIGLNDLALDLGYRFLFEPLAEGRLGDACAALSEAAIPFGIGGVARPGQGAVPAETILGEHARLGSSWVILSRAFRTGGVEGFDLGAELSRLREVYAMFCAQSEAELEANRHRFAGLVRAVVASLPTAPGRDTEGG